MKALKVVAIAFCLYAAGVVAFESLLGVFQPADRSTLVITTTAGDGTAGDRVLTSLQSRDQLYVSANHWPRRWYRQALENPEVWVAMGGQRVPYRAVAVTGAEHDRVNAEHRRGILFRILTGFPPRKFVRLDPVPPPRESEGSS